MRCSQRAARSGRPRSSSVPPTRNAAVMLPQEVHRILGQLALAGESVGGLRIKGSATTHHAASGDPRQARVLGSGGGRGSSMAVFLEAVLSGPPRPGQASNLEGILGRRAKPTQAPSSGGGPVRGPHPRDRRCHYRTLAPRWSRRHSRRHATRWPFTARSAPPATPNAWRGSSRRNCGHLIGPRFAAPGDLSAAF
jgi:hypothetical protein